MCSQGAAAHAGAVRGGHARGMSVPRLPLSVPARCCSAGSPEPGLASALLSVWSHSYYLAINVKLFNPVAVTGDTDFPCYFMYWFFHRGFDVSVFRSLPRTPFIVKEADYTRDCYGVGTSVWCWGFYFILLLLSFSFCKFNLRIHRVIFSPLSICYLAVAYVRHQLIKPMSQKLLK